MVVGQIVAISFAQNLFFATILVSRTGWSSHDNGNQHGNEDNDDNDKEGTWTPPLLLELIPIATSLLSTVSSAIHGTYQAFHANPANSASPTFRSCHAPSPSQSVVWGF